MGALASRLSAPPDVRCKLGRIIDSLDKADRAAIAEYRAAWANLDRVCGARHDHSPGRLERELAAVKIHIGHSAITRHFDGTCQCTRSDD